MSQTRLLIARHGNTFGPGDIVTRVGGRTDLPLVASGLQQGRELGQFLKQSELFPDLIFTSTLKRAIETAEQACIGMGQRCPITPIDLFNEIDYGPDENKPEADVVARLGAQALHDWDSNGIVPDGWIVDPNQLMQNWQDFARMLRTEHVGKTILVVTSNGIARFAPSLTGDFGGFKEEYGLKIATGALCLFTHDGESGTNSWDCLGWNWRPKELLDDEV